MASAGYLRPLLGGAVAALGASWALFLILWLGRTGTAPIPGVTLSASVPSPPAVSRQVSAQPGAAGKPRSDPAPRGVLQPPANVDAVAILGDDLAAAEAHCLADAVRRAVHDDPDLTGLLLVADFAQLRPLAERWARLCSIAPGRVIPVLGRALAQRDAAVGAGP